MFLVILNGPPGCGKDHAGGVLRDRVLPRLSSGKAGLYKFARVLKERTHALYGRPDLAWDAFENCKDVPNDFFLGLTPRQAYIEVSERYFKPLHGKDVYGRLLAADPEFLSADIAVITDGGFDAEAGPVIATAGADNVLLVRIRTRETADHPLYEPFPGDSRYFYDLPVRMVEIMNNKDRAFEDAVCAAVVEAARLILQDETIAPALSA